ncbi:NADPH dehydrogenase NamA [Fulvivirga maritima]|uniref:NADPH dehydrogenase NamA n=1 Tax=Fulvivirga maritima TaxID=2904247 RepID=UPI001F1FF00F|nr:NADPH dehydrogenase NamA [Fulvivirga maritima]UII25457.1 NADPH dehydrogenase NamA [Fulvivirga maritima]
MDTKSKLLSSYQLGNITLKNRIVISPMCQYSAVDGFANNWHLVHLGARAVGGAGLIIQEATAVSPEGRITHADLGLWKDDHIPPLKNIVDFVHQHGSKIGIQLAHAGRKASKERPWEGGKNINKDQTNGWQPIAPSPIPFSENEPLPHEMSLSEIQQVINDFKAATHRAIAANYDVIELHAGHGYLLHQFYSPLSNSRTDNYGGSFENRIRLIVEIVNAIKEIWGKEKPLMVRISATDWVDDGWQISDSVKFSEILKQLGVHLIDVSTAGNTLANIPVEPGYQVPFSSSIRSQANVPTGTVGLITTPEQAEKILQEEHADLIFIGRESLRNPNFPLYAAHILDDEHETTWPKQYERAYPNHGEWK